MAVTLPSSRLRHVSKLYVPSAFQDPLSTCYVLSWACSKDGNIGLEAQAAGDQDVHVCEDCHEAFQSQNPKLCRYALANHLWLGRWDPLFRGANLSHQMLLALARIGTGPGTHGLGKCIHQCAA